MKRGFKVGFWILTGAILLGVIYWYLQYEKRYPSTDDAYIQANVVYMASQVSGPIVAINTQENKPVRQGQWLVKIDPKPFKIAVDQAQAKLINAEQQVAAAKEALQVAKAGLNEKEARLILARRKTKRILTLVKKDLSSKESGDQAKSQLRVAIAAEVSAKSRLQQAEGQLGATFASVKVVEAALKQAKLNLQHTIIYSPVTGKVINFNLRVGDMVNLDRQLFAIIDTSDWWVQANFKETDLEQIKPGQKVKIKLDMYPGKAFRGVVQSVSGGSGTAFSLLPPENAAGNWIKVTQRFPVRITIEKLKKYPFRVGASALVRVDTIDKQYK